MCMASYTLHDFGSFRPFWVEKSVETRLAVGMDKPWTGDGFRDTMQKKPVLGTLTLFSIVQTIFA